jgi:hypothetical protein
LHSSLRKITQTCARARSFDGLDFVWIDTCCIDKRNKAELDEAINSMWAWYRGAKVCYVFLADLKPGTDADLAEDLPPCRWFTRGWTLQELIAPRKVLFFDQEWKYRGSRDQLAELLCAITKIPTEVLRGQAELGQFSIARRMSWAARRETTRVEDTAYCLLGIFDVNMMLNYGEGTRAFIRLQITIAQSTADLSIFTWTDDRNPCPPFAGMLAESPRQFASCDKIETVLGGSAYDDFTITTTGIQADGRLVQNQNPRNGLWSVALDTGCHIEGEMVGISVRRIGGSLCARSNPGIRINLGSLTSDFDEFQRLGLRRLLIERLTFATSLPPRYPFSSGINPVLGNRFSALCVNWGPVVAGKFDAMPRSHWDAHDSVSFCCHLRTKGWSAFFVGGRIESEATKPRSVKFFMACFGWNRPAPTVVLASLENLGSARRALLESQLDHIRFESSVRAQSLTFGVFDEKLQEELIATTLGPVKYYKGDSTPNQPAMDLRVGLKRELRPEVCVNPVVVLELFLENPSALIKRDMSAKL